MNFNLIIGITYVQAIFVGFVLLSSLICAKGSCELLNNTVSNLLIGFAIGMLIEICVLLIIVSILKRQIEIGNCRLVCNIEDV